jgi:hypothetical protein
MVTALLVLGQLPGSHPPPALPSAPFVERMLFEEPVGLVSGLVLLAVVLWVVFNRRGKARQGAALATGAMVLVGGVWLLAHSVKTEREQMAEATVALVDATARVDTAAMARILASDAHLNTGYSIPDVSAVRDGLDREGIIAAAERALERHPIKDHSVKEVQAESLGPGSGRTQVRVLATLEAFGFPHTSWWRIRWRREGEVWRAVAIEPLDIPGLTPR